MANSIVITTSNIVKSKTLDSGVYKITNSSTGKFYIGSSVTLKRRRTRHFRRLRNNSHHNTPLQRAYNNNPENIIFEIVLICPRDMCLFYEQCCIDALNPEYNISRNVRLPPFRKGGEHHQARPVIDSNTGKIYGSVQEASDELKIAQSLISRVCSGKIGKAKGYELAFVDGTSPKYVDKLRRSIVELNTGKVYTSITEASKDLKIAHSSISMICTGQRKSAKGYRFAYHVQ